MTYAFSPPRLLSAASRIVLIDVARCWSEALKSGQSVQPCLYRLLQPRNVQILTPVLDSLLHFYTRALGRPLAVGRALGLTRDEVQLVAVMDGSLERKAIIVGSEEVATGLDRAISSTRIMMRLASND